MAENILDIMVALYTFKAQNDTELSFDKARLFSFGFLTLGLSVLPDVLIIISLRLILIAVMEFSQSLKWSGLYLG